MATRVDLINDIAEFLNTSKASAGSALEATIFAICNRLNQKETVILRGFGSFSIRTTKARTGRNPQTGAEITIASKDKVVFKPSKAGKA